MPTFFNKNLYFVRKQKGISQKDLANKIGVDQSTVSLWEKGMDITVDNAIKVAEALNVSVPKFLATDLQFDNAAPIDLEEQMIQIPVLGVIKAGIPMEAQQDILEYVEIPKRWTAGGKTFFGLFICGDSMFPKYNDKDIVIFEKAEDMSRANNKDCAVMVNGDDATFKKVLLNENGITLVPYNTGFYDMVMYSKEDIINKPIKIIGVAREKRTKID